MKEHFHFQNQMDTHEHVCPCLETELMRMQRWVANRRQRLNATHSVRRRDKLKKQLTHSWTLRYFKEAVGNQYAERR
ncbi:unnamed protein product [Arctogadus glacialis]